MGRQINFYMDEKIQDLFVDYIFHQGFVVMYTDSNKKELVVCENKNNLNQEYYLFIYKKVFGELVCDENFNYELNVVDSPVIEFTKTMVKDEGKTIIRGRLWMETKYYDENNNLLLKAPKLTDEYNLLVKWIKKHIPFQEVMCGNHIIKEYISNDMKGLLNNGFKLM